MAKKYNLASGVPIRPPCEYAVQFRMLAQKINDDL